MNGRADTNVRPYKLGAFFVPPLSSLALPYGNNGVYVVTVINWHLIGVAGEFAQVDLTGYKFGRIVIPPGSDTAVGDALYPDMELEAGETLTFHNGASGDLSGWVCGYEWAPPVEQ